MAHQREVVLVIEVPNALHPSETLGVAKLTTQRIRGVRRVRDQPAVANEVDNLLDCSRLRLSGECRSL